MLGSEFPCVGFWRGGDDIKVMSCLGASSRVSGSVKGPGLLLGTGASHVTLPSAWRDRFGSFADEQEVDFETATQEIAKGIVCGPARIQVEGFRVINSEVLFVEMTPVDGEYEPQLGYIALEQCGAAVDLMGHRLLPVRSMDLKSFVEPGRHRLRAPASAAPSRRPAAPPPTGCPAGSFP